ncbi:ash family protein [Pectobacterium brasiliense]|nr:ash family protein [Pectobacterium brasiliense]MBN3138337.1 ash family protein [Pectobacterium punjabense]MCE5378819.1 ash family protein [Pectobacterium punjabense]
MTGCRNPDLLSAIRSDAPASFFISQPLLVSMVAQAGQPSGWPGR